MSAGGGNTSVEERARGRGWARRTLYGGGGAAGAVWRGAARPLAGVWRRVAERRLTVAQGAVRLPAPAIAVGNVTVGGGGKTSLVAWVLEEALPEGSVAAVLSRGYGRSGDGVWVLEPGPADPETARQAGDEPALLARRGAWVGVAADRARAAGAVARRARPDVYVLDDALQHRRVARALDLVAFTAADLTAPARCLPAGPLRQGPGWMPERGAWIVTGADPRREEWPRGTIGAAFAAWWREVPGTGADWESGPAAELGAWVAAGEAPFHAGGREVVAFAGVARPESVRRTAVDAGVPLAGLVAYADHARYTPRLVAALLRAHSEAAFVTTEKDAVKLDPAWFAGRPVGVLRRRLVPRDPELLRVLVAEALAAGA